MIKPSIRHEKTVTDKDARCSNNPDFVQKICELNVKYQIESILRCSDILEDMTKDKSVGIVGAVYDIANGKVSFMQDSFVGL